MNGFNMNKKEIEALLDDISKAAINSVSTYGVQGYEHSDQWRPCEQAISHGVYLALRGQRRTTFEASQKGISKLCDQDQDSKKRYDLAFWGNDANSNKPVAVCEFKWSFSPAAFVSDAAKVLEAPQSVLPLLCLIVVSNNNDEKEPKKTIDEHIAKLKNEKYTIRLGGDTCGLSHIKAIPLYQFGKLVDRSRYAQIATLCLERPRPR